MVDKSRTLEGGCGRHRWNGSTSHRIRQLHTVVECLARRLFGFLRVKHLFKALATVIAGALILGIVYEQFGRRQDRKRLPQIGRSVDIGGRSLNIYCSGTGGPTVVFESGGDGPGLGWQSIQSQVAAFTQACWYDRAGIGWSDPGPYPRTSAAIGRDLHELLKRAGVPPPYVLAGASFGGLNSRVYNGLYPQEVASMVLIDSAHEDEPIRAPKFYLARTLPRWLWHPASIAFQTAANVGLIRLFQTSPPQSNPGSPLTPYEIIAALRRQPKSVANNAMTGIVIPESYEEARAAAWPRGSPAHCSHRRTVIRFWRSNYESTGRRLPTGLDPRNASQTRPALHARPPNRLRPQQPRQHSQ